MKYLLLVCLGLFISGCSYDCRKLPLSHVGVKPSVGYEMEKGHQTKTKASIEINLDWNL